MLPLAPGEMRGSNTLVPSDAGSAVQSSARLQRQIPMLVFQQRINDGGEFRQAVGAVMGSETQRVTKGVPGAHSFREEKSSDRAPSLQGNTSLAA